MIAFAYSLFINLIISNLIVIDKEQRKQFNISGNLIRNQIRVSAIWTNTFRKRNLWSTSGYQVGHVLKPLYHLEPICGLYVFPDKFLWLLS